MNRVVPLAPVYRKVACIPPIIVKTTVAEICQLGPEIQVGVEETVE